MKVSIIWIFIRNLFFLCSYSVCKFRTFSEAACIHVCLSNLKRCGDLPFLYRITLHSVDICPSHYLLLFHFTSPYRPHNGLKLPPSVLDHLKITIVHQWTTILCGLCSPIKRRGGMVMRAWHLFPATRTEQYLKNLQTLIYCLLLLQFGSLTKLCNSDIKILR